MFQRTNAGKCMYIPVFKNCLVSIFTFVLSLKKNIVSVQLFQFLNSRFFYLGPI